MHYYSKCGLSNMSPVFCLVEMYFRVAKCVPVQLVFYKHFAEVKLSYVCLKNIINIKQQHCLLIYCKCY